MTPISPDDPAAVLNAAADLIERDGWHQGEFWPDHGTAQIEYQTGMPCCPVGAMAVILGFTCSGQHPVGAAYTPAATLLRRLVPAIAGWNDALGQTAANVIATMREAARAAP